MSRAFSSPIKKPVVKESVLKGQSWEVVLQEFVLVKKAEGRAWRTLDDYKGHISRFFRKYPEAWEDETKHRDYLLEYLGRGIGPTVHNLDQLHQVISRFLHRERDF